MKKRRLKIFSALLAVVMFALSFATVATAKAMNEVEVTRGELLLSIDDMSDTTNNVNGLAWMNGSVVRQQSYVSAEGSIIKQTDTPQGAWVSYIGKTSLPLSAETSYVITFDAKLLGNYDWLGFAFSQPGTMNIDGVSKSGNYTRQGIVFSNSAQRVGMMTGMTFPTTVHSIDQTKLDSVNSYTVSIEASFSQVVVDQIHAFWGTLAIYALCTSGHFLTTI